MPEPLPLDEQLCFSLYAATIAINRAYKPVLDRLGITYPQFLVLQVLNGAEEGRSIGEIGERRALEPSTITRSPNGWRRRGWSRGCAIPPTSGRCASA